MTSQQSESSVKASLDTDLGRFVVEQGLATREEVQRCLSLQAQRSANEATLAQLLVQEGVCTQTQINRVTTTIERTRSGQQIPGYQILSKLGSGAMATTFKARQMSLDRMVAIKVLPKRLSENPDYVRRFYEEGKAAAKLNHANIAQAYDVGEAGGYHYFVMEYIEGHTLYDEIASGKVFSEAEALKVIMQIARALEHAHAQGLIHRDVKPKNIMITRNGEAKLVDMGLARNVADMEAAQAEAGRAFGTPYYISPEQIRGEVNIDFRADIYSLGATLYHMVTGRVPFEASTPTAVMHKHLKDDLRPPDHINDKLSAGIGEVVEVMMAKDPQRRYASTSDLLLDLESIARGEAPLQARKSIDAAVLGELANGSDPDAPDPSVVYMESGPGNLLFYLMLLGGALAVSLILNIFLLLR